MVSYITHEGFGESHTIQIGRVLGVQREGRCEDICLERALAIDCPLTVTIVIRTTGEIILWQTAWGRSDNTYWHFAAGSEEDSKVRRPTQGQLATLERMFLKLVHDMPGNLGTALGGPVAKWAFAGQTPSDIATKHRVPAPRMNY